MNCPWCDGTARQGKLCDACRHKALGMGRLSAQELERLPYGVIRLDREGTVLSVNNAETAMSGIDAKMYLGRNFFAEVAPCANVQSFAGRFQEFLESDVPLEEFSFLYKFAAGNLTVRITLVRDPLDVALLVVSKTLRP